jgi:hypothetical protein
LCERHRHCVAERQHPEHRRRKQQFLFSKHRGLTISRGSPKGREARSKQQKSIEMPSKLIESARPHLPSVHHKNVGSPMDL